jgi:hypothetical protein
MKRTSAPLLGAILLLAWSQPVHAELINWSYTWSSVPDVVLADAPGTGKIYLDKQATGSVEVSTEDPETDIVATNIRTESTASISKPDVFTNAGFTLSLKITDGNSNTSETLFFRGVFNGKLTARSSMVRPTLNPDDIEQSIQLGDNIYTVRITTITPPGPPTSTNSGSIGARALVKVNDIKKVPEPSSWLTGIVGVAMLYLIMTRRRTLLSF